MRQRLGCWLLALLAPLCLISLFVLGSNLYWRQRLQWYNVYLYEIAEQVGYTSSTHLEQGRSCIAGWSMYIGLCRVYVSFSTPVALDELAEKVEQLKLEITYDSGDGFWSEQPTCTTWRDWRLKDEDKNTIGVYFCERKEEKPRHTQKEQPTAGNIISVTVEVGQIPHWVWLPKAEQK